ncbi:lipoprotein-releasing ABC transporter permease subunit [Dissulfurimicrobium hydrothermale]|nr:lipoprotein-releasing ABC transporter permease subunit [Dissulfurimicrobium hydrothermale]UKL14628.1 lipoprotein-releasing ABC transporter permease subunit [Dissulfurimicrobium hydrothermale]
MPFEWFMAFRYLKAKRKQAFISLITFISIAGVAIGVMALIVVISVMGGFEDHLRTKILGVSSHIVVRSYKGPIFDYKEVEKKILSVSVSRGNLLERIFGVNDKARVVAATPLIYIQALLSSGHGVSGAIIRGVDPRSLTRVMDTGKIISGKGLVALNHRQQNGPPPIILGKELARTLGVSVGQTIQIILPSGMITPIGMLPKIRSFVVVGIDTTGMFDYDSSLAFIGLEDAQRLLQIRGQVHSIELKVSDIYASDRLALAIDKRLGPPFWAMDWQQMSRNLFSALKLEKLAMFIVLTLIVLVAAFNIVSTLIMMVMEKHQDIAILKAIGTTDRQILKIFVYNGLAVGLIGTAIGVMGGVSLCELLSRYKFIKIPRDVYYTDSLPILLRSSDVITIAACAVIICFIATIYPARQAAKVNPSEALRNG